MWLLIFRDIGIYAVRVLSKDWLTKSLSLRWISVFHATCLRVWIALFLVQDGFRLFVQSDFPYSRAFEIAQLAVLWTTIVVSYYGLFRSFSWLADRDQEGL